MRPALTIAVVVCLTAQIARADKPSRPSRPMSPSPMIVVGQAVMKGESVVIHLLRSDYRAEKRTRTVNIGDKVVEQTYTVMVPVMFTTQMPLGGEKGARVVDLASKPVDAKERLKEPTPMLVCFGEKADPAYLNAVKEGTLVLTLSDRLPRLTPISR